MSMIAALLVLQAAPAGGAPTTAEQALAAHRGATSIGPDPCRTASEDEIIVCGRREKPYAVPLYAAEAGPDAQAGGRRTGQMKDVVDAQGACAMQLAQCRPPAAFNGTKFMGGVMKIVEALTDGE